jgi:hypothetical protein
VPGGGTTGCVGVGDGMRLPSGTPWTGPGIVATGGDGLSGEGTGLEGLLAVERLEGGATGVGSMSTGASTAGVGSIRSDAVGGGPGAVIGVGGKVGGVTTIVTVSKRSSTEIGILPEVNAAADSVTVFVDVYTVVVEVIVPHSESEGLGSRLESETVDIGSSAIEDVCEEAGAARISIV